MQKRSGKMHSLKDFVIGGHTQRIQFVKNVGNGTEKSEINGICKHEPKITPK